MKKNYISLIFRVFVLITFCSVPCFSQVEDSNSSSAEDLHRLLEIRQNNLQKTNNISESEQLLERKYDDNINRKYLIDDFSKEKTTEENKPWKDDLYPFVSHEIYLMKLKENAEFGDADSAARLGELYVDGKIAEKDSKKIGIWLTKAAGNGNYKAQYNLGEMYIAGQGVAQDYKVAADLFEQAAIQGDAFAQYHIAIMAENSIGINRNNEKAFYWYAFANYLTGGSDTKNFEALAKKMGVTNFQPTLTMAQKNASMTSNLRNVSLNEIYKENEKFANSIFENAPKGYMGFIYPKSIKNGQNKISKLIFSRKKEEIISKCSNDEEKKIQENIKIHTTMSAKLSGSAFQIGLIDEKIQDMNPDKDTIIWTWEIKPKKSGLQNLNVLSKIVVKLQGEILKAFRSPFEPTKINMKVIPLTKWEKFIRMLNNNLTEIIKGLFITVFGGLILYIIIKYL